ncbi:timeless interacting-related [Holotrichia oblita]|uniref:Timeless interacting-related n=1 Tax=Holotrichia oblita TaxID=644536 RepID=A0ACB9TP40_HOLOL|nr:timeless interacting-related [Holotrichia oblita]
METSIDLYAEEYVDDYAEASDDNLEQEVEGENQIEAENENLETENNEDNTEEKKKVKPKRVIRNPRPKIDVETLKGSKGLLCLQSYFENKKFKGRGSEEQDLRTIMKTYEYWCHRLVPKFSFDDCLAKLEKLGTKKNIQVYLKRIRMDLVTGEDQPIVSDHEGEDLDELNIPQFDDLFPAEDRNADENATLTEEQLERIRYNKEKANRRLQAKLQQTTETITERSPEDFSTGLENVESSLKNGISTQDSVLLQTDNQSQDMCESMNTE